MTLNAHIVPRWGWLLALAFLTTCPMAAQRINFGAYAGSLGITLYVSGPLRFNDKQPVIVSGSTVTITLNDTECQWIEITGDATRDITITISADANLTGTGDTIPFTCQFAYSNLGSATVGTAKAVAVQIPSGFTSITLPMQRRMAGVPAPPPTPPHSGYTPPSAKVYLFLYGTLGPVGNVAAGTYSGTIHVDVQY